MSLDTSWEDQWEDFTSLSKSTHPMHHFTPRAYQSPSASESSSSVSTQASPSFSAQSEASPFAGRSAPHSPDVSHRKVCRIGLFYNPPIVKHVNFPSMQNVSREEKKEKDGLLLQERCLLEDIQHASGLNIVSELVQDDVKSFVKAKEAGPVHPSIDPSEEGWLSDSTESWASASSQELTAANYSSNEAEDVPSLSLYETPQIHLTNHNHEQGERGWGTAEQAGHAATHHSAITNQYDDENTDISEMQSYAGFDDENANISEMQWHAELNDEKTSCDNEDYTHDSLPVRSQFDEQIRAPASGLSSMLDSCPLSEIHAPGLETRCIDRDKGLHSRGHAINLKLDMQHNQRGEGDASCRINADCLIEDHHKPVHSAGDGHEPLECNLLNVDDTVLQSQKEHIFHGSFSTDSKSSAYIESESHSKKAHLNSPHSAAVEDKYPSSSLHGHFRLVEQGGSQCYSFSVHDSDDMFFARATCQPNNEEVPDYTYTFHCRREETTRKSGWKTSLKKEKLASSRLVGKMKVFNAMRMPTNNGCIEETRFVLYGEKSQLSPEKEGFSNNSVAIQGIPAAQVELAALVITTTVKEYKVTRSKIWESSLKEGAGWGAAFLEKSLERRLGAGCSSTFGSKVKAAAASKEDQAANHTERHHEITNWAEKILNKKLSRSRREHPKIAVDVVVILPAGHHGLPRQQDSADDGGPWGPTPLLECWQSGGKCHCGGWDTGCGLSVLKATTFKMNKPRETIALTNRDRINWITPQKPLQIFTHGWKQNRLLMLEMVETGLFSLSFQARFSPLQAFATVVAIFHEQLTHE